MIYIFSGESREFDIVGENYTSKSGHVELLPGESNYNQGFGGLPDAISCNVTEERNGSYELELQYPLGGVNSTHLQAGNILYCKPNPYSDKQAFRIYQVSEDTDHVITAYAQHISYDLNDCVIKPFEASTLGLAINRISENVLTPNRSFPFTFWTDKSANGEFAIDVPTNIRSILAGNEGSLLDVFGTFEYEFDNWQVKIHGQRGTERDLTIKYGRNMTSFSFQEDFTNMYTHIVPYWIGPDPNFDYSATRGQNENGEYVYNGEVEPEQILVTLDNMIIEVGGEYSLTDKVGVLDCSSVFDEPPTQKELADYAIEYIKDSEVGDPSVSIEVSFVDLAGCIGPDKADALSRVRLCDIVNVEPISERGWKYQTKVIKTDYNVITNQYDTITLGNYNEDLAATIDGTQSWLKKLHNEVPTKTNLQIAIENATKLITGGLGGHVVIHSSSGDDSRPDEILIMDTPDIETAQKVWRWNKGGLGYSSNGYNGTFSTAMTSKGEIVADKITAGTLDGAIIRGGTILGDALDVKYKEAVSGEITSKLEVVDKKITAEVRKKVGSDEIISSINMSPEEVKIKSNKLKLEGYTSINEKTQIDTNGTLYTMNEIANQINVLYGMEIWSENHNRGEAYIDFHGCPHTYKYNSTLNDYWNRLSYEYSSTSSKLILKSGWDDEYGTTEGTRFEVGTVVCTSLVEASDKRLKKDIESLDPDKTYDMMMSLKPKSFRMIDNDEKIKHGFIFQEVQETVKDGDWAFFNNVDKEDKLYGALNYIELIADLVSVVQTQDKRITELEKQIQLLSRKEDENG